MKKQYEQSNRRITRKSLHDVLVGHRFYSIFAIQLFVFLYNKKKVQYSRWSTTKCTNRCLPQMKIIAIKISNLFNLFIHYYLRWNRCGWTTTTMEKQCEQNIRMKIIQIFPLSLLEHAEDKYIYKRISVKNCRSIGKRQSANCTRCITLLACVWAHKLWLIFVEGASDAIMSFFLLYWNWQMERWNTEKKKVNRKEKKSWYSFKICMCFYNVLVHAIDRLKHWQKIKNEGKKQQTHLKIMKI